MLNDSFYMFNCVINVYVWGIMFRNSFFNILIKDPIFLGSWICVLVE